MPSIRKALRVKLFGGDARFPYRVAQKNRQLPKTPPQACSRAPLAERDVYGTLPFDRLAIANPRCRF